MLASKQFINILNKIEECLCYRTILAIKFVFRESVILQETHRRLDLLNETTQTPTAVFIIAER